MIVRASEARRDTGSAEAVAALGAFEALLYSDTGGTDRHCPLVKAFLSDSGSSERQNTEQ
ncbi:hypothetical protein [Algicella marina]|uniref:Uncharacterized protein n=1 Tax=Algicella marina TaxID=2683284 RepID=A0A6P1SXZ7_9RHOB|nr:hypothetical protein [Algicella marina]QHQ35554.1 hypothetical protein GO499_10360 [Algicella marina]